jgi:hypothetical protein
MTPCILVDAYQISVEHTKVIFTVSCCNLCGEKKNTPTERTVISILLFFQTKILASF